jgi:hypothetical protein
VKSGHVSADLAGAQGLQALRTPLADKQSNRMSSNTLAC